MLWAWEGRDFREGVKKKDWGPGTWGGRRNEESSKWGVVLGVQEMRVEDLEELGGKSVIWSKWGMGVKKGLWTFRAMTGGRVQEQSLQRAGVGASL